MSVVFRMALCFVEVPYPSQLSFINRDSPLYLVFLHLFRPWTPIPFQLQLHNSAVLFKILGDGTQEGLYQLYHSSRSRLSRTHYAQQAPLPLASSIGLSFTPRSPRPNNALSSWRDSDRHPRTN